MADTPIVLKSAPGIKRDGTKFEGDNYTDGQWVRWQRNLPRKIAGYRSTQKYLAEVSRGLSAFTQKRYSYCHSGGSTKLERWTMDGSAVSSLLTDRTPVATYASGTVTLTGGTSGSVNSITVDGIDVMGGAESFASDLDTTATNVADNITAHASTPNYNASADGATITITASTTGHTFNNLEVVSTTTDITTTDTDMTGGGDALVANDNNNWMFDYQYDSSTSQNYILAHVAQNLDCACNDTGGQIFFGDVLGTGRLQSVELPPDANCTGGVVSLHPYLMYYGTDGIVGWSKAGEPTDFTDLSGGAGIARPWGQKIIKGLPLRGNSGPAGIFWAWDAVIRASFTGGATVWSFDVVATNTSILSSDCVIDYDGVYMWAGVDRFMMFNGVVREIPNNSNLNWFYDGLNMQQRSKVFAFKVPKYGEVWWCYPRGDAEECTHAVIFNLRENAWYDTELPTDGRTAGGFNNAFAAPILAGANSRSSGYYAWLHEQGTDEIDGSQINSIPSWFETADLSTLVQGKDANMRLTRVEPDFVQAGDMTVQVTGRANARAPEVYSSQFTFVDEATSPQEQIVLMKEQRRELRLRFESNAVGGDYQMGQIIGHISAGDKTTTS